MKNLLLFFLSFGSFLVLAQEEIKPLSGNPYLKPSEQRQRAAGNGLDSTFVFIQSNTLTLPVWDDFSVNKFEQYNPNFTDANVTSQWYYRLMNSTNTIPINPSFTFCDSSHTYHDSIFVVAGIGTTSTSYPTAQEVFVNDLNSYPIQGISRFLFQECYVLIDSVIDGVPDPTQDTIWYNLLPDFVQDSAHVFFANLNNPNTIWVDNKACHNYRYAVNPWSIGFATFDGVDTNGVPYDFGNPNAHEIADYLTTKSINLLGQNDVYLTWIYQAGGHGNDPEAEDSLILEFFDPSTQEWNQEWATPGGITTDIWDTVHIAVPLFYLQNGFKFRFKNYASTSGNLDHWHIDYVQLKANDLPSVSNFSDLAIAYPINSLLKDYTSVPWDHYKNAIPSQKMLDTAHLFVYNSDLTPTNFANGQLAVYYQSAIQAGTPYVLPNTLGTGWEIGLNDYSYPVGPNFTYDPSVHDSLARFNVKLNIAAGVGVSNQYDVNDTTYFTQVFANYYAYDDGSAEVAYGLNGSHAQLAYKFEAYEADTLKGILMSFMPTVEDVTNKIFLLTIWSDNNGVPGDIVYQDDYFTPHNPIYANYKNGFVFYTFADGAAIPVDEIFYVGFEQIENQSLNLGMDLNIDNSDKIFYNVTGNWNNTSYPASLLIRPVFSTKINNTLGIEESVQVEFEDITIYPNPSTGFFSISGISSNQTVLVYDLSGREILREYGANELDLSWVDNGVYIVVVQNQNAEIVHTSKIIKSE